MSGCEVTADTPMYHLLSSYSHLGKEDALCFSLRLDSAFPAASSRAAQCFGSRRADAGGAKVYVTAPGLPANHACGRGTLAVALRKTLGEGPRPRA
eukprot:6206759-Pleurochrysis_carterae.AAC.1